jgi:hypothetical protein
MLKRQNQPNIVQEGLEGIYANAIQNGVYGPLANILVSNLVLQREPATCGDQRDTIIAEYQEDYLWNGSYYPVQWAPVCNDFTMTARTAHYQFSDLNVSGSQHKDANGQYYKWALLRYAMMVPASYPYGLEQLVNQIEKLATDPSLRAIHSAYRSPAVNEAVGGTFQPGQNSRHMFGDAVDLQNNAGTANGCTPALAKQAGACCVPAQYNGHSYGGTCTADPGAAFIEYTQLAQAAMNANSNFVEPIYYRSNGSVPIYTPGPCFLGCVHVDWRNKPGLYAP